MNKFIFSNEFILKFLKFGVVGASGVVVDFGITWLLKEKAKLHKYVANTAGFMTAATSNYFLNRWWTFQSHDPNIGMQYSKFLLISLIGLGINTFVIWLLTSKFKWNFYFAKLIAIGVVTLWNFFLNWIFTF